MGKWGCRGIPLFQCHRRRMASEWERRYTQAMIHTHTSCTEEEGKTDTLTVSHFIMQSVTEFYVIHHRFL